MAAEVDERRLRPVALQLGRHFRLVPGAPHAFEIGNEIVAALGADLAGEARRALAGEKDMRQALHHRAGDGDRMEEALEGADRAGAQRRPVHDRGVELDLADEIGPAAAPHRADRLVALDEADAGFDRLERPRRPPSAAARS